MEQIGLKAILDMSQFNSALQEYRKALDTVGVSLTAAGAVMTGAATKVTLTAARTEELGIVLNRVGANIGKTADDMAEYEAGVKGMGITTQASRQALIQMVQAQIDLSHATDLARLAQDAAVIAQMDSSEAYETLITLIQRGSPIMARTLGLVVDFQGAYEKKAAAIGKSANELTAEEKIEARVQNVLENSIQIAGTYEAAMETAGKQMRSMRRYAEEAANEFGEHLLPAMSSIVKAGTDLLKWVNAMPEPLQATIAQVVALGGGLATVGGTAMLAIPRIMSLASALSTFAGMVGTTTAGLLGPLGLIAAIAALAIYMNNLEKANRDEAAAMVGTSNSYKEYLGRLEHAELGSYALSESLYEVAQAAEEAGGAIDALALTEAFRELDFMIGGAVTGVEELDELFLHLGARGGTVQSWQRLITTMDDAQLTVLKDEEAVRKLGKSAGYTDKRLRLFMKTVMKAADEELELRIQAEGLRKETEQVASKWQDYADALAGVVRKEDEATDATEDLEKAQEALEKAVEEARKSYEGFFSTLAGGVGDLRDLDKAAVQSAEDYDKEIKKLNSSAAKSLQEVQDNFEASLPDRTTVQDRMGMAEDAWDEWGLRIQDIIQNGVASPWYAALQEMGYSKPPDVGMTAWAQDLQNQFYAGRLPDLLPPEWAENVRQQQEEATRVVQAENAKRRAEVEAARQAELEAQAQERQETFLKLSLSLAEQRNLLQAWSLERFGPDLSPSFDTADEVFEALDQGIIDLDASLQEIIGKGAVDISETLDMTKSKAEETQDALDTILNPDAIEEQKNAIAQALDESYQLAVDNFNKLEAPWTSTMATVAPEREVFDPLFQGFETARQDIEVSAGLMGTELGGTFTQIGTDWDTMQQSAASQWNTAQQIIVTQAGQTSSQLSTSFTGINTKWSSMVNTMVADWDKGMGKVQKTIRDKVIKELEKIPEKIVITVETKVTEGQTGTEGGEGRQHGGPVSAGVPVMVGEGGPEPFIPHAPGTVIPNWRMNIPALLGSAGGTAGGTTGRAPVQITINPVINSRMDMAEFEARTLQTVQRAIRGG